jgi:hypothetical protein
MRVGMSSSCVVALTFACSSKSGGPPTSEPQFVTTGETARDLRDRLRRELAEDMLASYQRDKSLMFATRVANPWLIDMRVGSGRIGVGPGDVRVGGIINPDSWRRWPLTLRAGTTGTVHSKRLRVWLAAADPVEAAWVSDDVSWHVPVCGKTAVIPFRITALFARAGDQWYEVFEHVSYGRAGDGPSPRGARMPDAFPAHELVEYPSGELGRPLADLLSGDRDRRTHPIAFDPSHRASTDPLQPAPSFLIGPRFDSEWHAGMGLDRIELGGPVRPEDRRAALLGRSNTIAYWIGNFVGEQASKPAAHLRGTFIFEKRCRLQSCRWLVVQGHLSRAIDDVELARRTLGSVVTSTSPLRFDCDALRVHTASRVHERTR